MYIVNNTFLNICLLIYRLMPNSKQLIAKVTIKKCLSHCYKIFFKYMIFHQRILKKSFMVSTKILKEAQN